MKELPKNFGDRLHSTILSPTLAQVLAENVSDSDTAYTERLEYIPLSQIDEDPNNFYELSGVEELAANIQFIGLQQPIRVRTNPENTERVIIVSGHRRYAALKLLAKEDARFQSVPCIRENANCSAAMQELRLIYANSDTRRMTSAELSKQAQRVEELLYQLKEAGVHFPGRMRDHVAEACKLSKTKLARLKMIREKLDPCWQSYYKKSTLHESTAYRLSQMPPKHQQAIFEAKQGKIKYFYESTAERLGKRLAEIDRLTCDTDGAPCKNHAKKYRKTCFMDEWTSFKCGKCCAKCEDLAKCKYACPNLADEARKLREDARLQRKQEQQEKEEKERPVIEKLQKYWKRFGEARNAADKSVRDCYAAVQRMHADIDEQKIKDLESLKANFTPYTTLPYGYSCYLSEVEKYVRIADLLDCSLDYLLCRTDERKPQTMPDGQLVISGWMPGGTNPRESGEVVAVFDLGDGRRMKRLCYFDGRDFRFKQGGTIIGMPPLKWLPVPPEGE